MIDDDREAAWQEFHDWEVMNEEDVCRRTRRPMNDLLTLAVKAHGGMQRWEQISRSAPPCRSRARSGT
jgi:hypothetical protein